MRKLSAKSLLSIGALVLIWPVASVLAQVSNKSREAVTVKVSVDKHLVTIGDKIRYEITVRAPKDIEVQFPDFGAAAGNFAIKDFGFKKQACFGKQTLRQWYVLDTYVIGKSIIPKAVIKYKVKVDTEWRQRETEEVGIEVRSVLGKVGSIEVDIVDVESPVPLPSKKSRVVLWLALIALMGVSGIALVLRNRRLATPLAFLRPAHEIAYEQLEALEKKDFIREGKIKEYFVEISDVIRHYLENRFSLRAPEMTTEEFLAGAHAFARLSSEQKVLLREFLTSCDLVKFARYLPVSDEVAVTFQLAKKLIDQTKEESKEAVAL